MWILRVIFWITGCTSAMLPNALMTAGVIFSLRPSIFNLEAFGSRSSGHYKTLASCRPSLRNFLLLLPCSLSILCSLLMTSVFTSKGTRLVELMSLLTLRRLYVLPFFRFLLSQWSVVLQKVGHSLNPQRFLMLLLPR